MKRVLGNSIVCLCTAALLLTSCNSFDKSVKVAYNLDYLSYTSETKAFPTELTGSQLDMMISSKQDFVLYFHSKNCATCKIVNPYYDLLLNPTSGGTAYDLYAFSANSADFSWINSRYPNLFDATPKTMFFKGGENVLTLSSSRYKSYKIFESAMNQFVIKSNIYTAKTNKAISKFINETDKEEYFVFLRTSEKVNDSFPSYEYWSSNVYPIVKDSDIPTLVLDFDNIEQEAKKTINDAYGLNSINSAIYVDKYSYTVYNYYDEVQSTALIKLINEKL